jgi:TetR/AcrR family transcriptional repressor of lmrAB and yxaGH operons
MGYSPATKEVLIGQLREVFVARGYDGATLTNLASAANLSKASLYHHFPGGKPEMVAALVRHTIADLQRKAFHHLDGTADPEKKIASFIDGFFAYTNGGESDCLLAILNHHSTAGEEIAGQQQTIAEQFADWHASLTTVFESAGIRPKKADREAHDLIAALYGALFIAKMHNQPQLFVQAHLRVGKRVKKRFRSL